MKTPPDSKPPLVDTEPSWERRPSENEAFAAPAHDPRDIITPHAFRIAPQLLGLPLAAPKQRALAIGVDLALVFFLAKTGGVVLAALVAVFAYSWLKNRYRPSSRIGRGLSTPARLILAILIFSLAVSVLQPVWERYMPDLDDDDDDAAPTKALSISGVDGLALGAAVIALKACDDAECRREAAQGMGAAISETEGDTAVKRDKLDELIDEIVGDEAERTSLKAAAADSLNQAEAEPGSPQKAAAADAAIEKPEPSAEEKAAKDNPKPEYSILKQLYGLIDDLGLSAGWAAAYFTFFTTLWAGQTPGKRMMKIRVVHLSGKPLSYWMSFGRYGGYAAGLTTGLLGFLQIYWDPNRQAVQDQLSFTAVIRDVDLSQLKIGKKA
ncbi:RDD family protein [Hydrocarboniphaga sp.]|uniref:RDD family protein n=1 Tax=Hydrocarboniphaga sp. TaxID=2033016 RepID=UPI003D124F06